MKLSLLLVMSLAFLATSCSQKKSVEPPNVDTAAIDPFLRATITDARGAVIASPDSAESWGRFGQALHAAEFTTQAQQCYARAVELDPQSPRWTYLLGLLELQNDPASALKHLNRAIELGGTNEAPRFALSRALIEHGRFDDARGNLETLIKNNPNHAAARVELARVVVNGDLEGARVLLKPALTNGYTVRGATLLLAQVEQRAGNADLAAQLSRRAAAMPRPFDWPDPYLREVQSLRADRAKLAEQINSWLQQQRYSDAESALNNLLRAVPNDPEGLLLLGRLRYLQKNCTQAEAALRRHLEVQPNSLNGLIQLGIALLCQQRWNDAASVLEQATALKPDFAQAHSNLAYALSHAGDSAGAIQAYRNALRCNPGDLNTHIALADELGRAGKKEEALKELDRVISLNPKDPRISQLRERLEK
jgi:tetratricopeptide (TPR) repeat protein